MSIATNLAKLGLGVSTTGVIAAEKGGTGTTTGGSGGPKITSIVVTDSSYTTLDDTAVSTAGGYIKIIGSGFASGCQVLVNNTTATSVTFISATEVRAQVPATIAGTYIVYLVNSDGGVAIRVNGITFSATPTWNTVSPISGVVDTAISLQLDATSATTYALAAGSSLPSGVTLSNTGLLSGTVTGITSETTYNFTVVATDAELQDSPKAFAFNVTAGDLYFKYNTLLLSANGTNNAQNNTFVDSSTNAFTITRVGNTTQGTFSPYYTTNTWAYNFDGGSGSYLTATYSTSSFDWWTSDYTIEAWVYASSWATWGSGTAYGQSGLVGNYTSADSTNYWSFGPHTDGTIKFYYWNGSQNTVSSSQTLKLNQWNHIAVTKTSSGIRLWVNGVGNTVTAVSGTPQSSNSTALTIGRSSTSNSINGSVSNLRIVKGTAVYTANFTPPTQPLTAITNTQLLTCNSNTIVDSSANALTITKAGMVGSGRPSLGPFTPSFPYSASAFSGSVYFDGSSKLTVPAGTAFAYGTGDFTVEGWFFVPTMTLPNYGAALFAQTVSGTNYFLLYLDGSSNGVPSGKIGWTGATSGSGAGIASGSNLYTAGTWNHFAVCRVSGMVTVYLNGLGGTATANSTNFTDTSYLPTVGGYTNGAANNFTGYLSNLRVVKGTAVYTGNFTPPTTPLTAITNTSLLCNFTNAGIVDATMQNNLEIVGDAKISTTQSKFGGSSMYFDGTGDYITSTNNAFTFGTDDFTVECWAYFNNLSNTPMIWHKNASSSGWFFEAGTNTLYFGHASANSGQYYQLTGITLTTSTWYHLAVTRVGTTLSIFLNGTKYSSTVSGAGASADNTAKSVIGSYSPNSSSYDLNGYIDDFRITRGLARYTANFTPPGAAAPQ
jgi:hypothetical protein